MARNKHRKSFQKIAHLHYNFLSDCFKCRMFKFIEGSYPKSSSNVDCRKTLTNMERSQRFVYLYVASRETNSRKLIFVLILDRHHRLWPNNQTTGRIMASVWRLLLLTSQVKSTVYAIPSLAYKYAVEIKTNGDTINYLMTAQHVPSIVYELPSLLGYHILKVSSSDSLN